MSSKNTNDDELFADDHDKAKRKAEERGIPAALLWGGVVVGIILIASVLMYFYMAF